MTSAKYSNSVVESTGLKIAKGEAFTEQNVLQVISIYVRQNWGQFDDFSVSDLGRAFKTGITLAATIDEHVIGILRGYSDFYKIAWIAEVVVDPDFSRKGIGSKLVDEFLKMSNADSIYLEALNDSVSFFEKKGFKLRGKLNAMSMSVK